MKPRLIDSSFRCTCAECRRVPLGEQGSSRVSLEPADGESGVGVGEQEPFHPQCPCPLPKYEFQESSTAQRLRHPEQLEKPQTHSPLRNRRDPAQSIQKKRCLVGLG